MSSSNYDDPVDKGNGFRVGDLVRGNEGGRASALGTSIGGGAKSPSAPGTAASMPHFSPGNYVIILSVLVYE